jgi:4-hydroxybenzoate polyprenyltransferase
VRIVVRRPQRISLVAIAQLLRLPNVFTALADILLGYYFTHESLLAVGLLTGLLAASASLYSAGMVLNDVLDLEQDLRERPGRPIPSGRIARPFAVRLAVGLLCLGVLCGGGVSLATGDVRPVAVAAALCLAVVLYDGPLKRTPLAPLVMGSCRTLNVLLGMSLAPQAWQATHFGTAVGLGLYIAGVTWFARREAAASSRGMLLGGLLTACAGLVLLAALPHWPRETLAEVSQPRVAEQSGLWWYVLWLAVGLPILRRMGQAAVAPSPPRVQAAVRLAILSVIVLDAVCVYAVRGPLAAVVILSLLAPTLLLGRWLYST